MFANLFLTADGDSETTCDYIPFRKRCRNIKILDLWMGNFYNYAYMQTAILILRFIQAGVFSFALIKIWNGLDIGQQGKPKNKFGLIAHFAFLVMYLLFAVISLYTLFHNFTDKPNGREICITWLLWVGSEMINQLIMLYILEQMNNNFNECIDKKIDQMDE